MKTISKLFVMFVCFIMIGCITIQSEKPVVAEKAAVVEKTITIPETKTSWGRKELELQKAMQFAKFAMDPNMRVRYEPESLFNIVSCIIDVLAVHNTYEQYKKRFAENPISQEAQQELYGISYKCAQDEVNLMKMKKESEPDLKNTI